MFSDFRAVGAETRLIVRDRTRDLVLYDRWVNTMNAVEYAYEAPVAEDTAEIIRQAQRESVKI